MMEVNVGTDGWLVGQDGDGDDYLDWEQKNAIVYPATGYCRRLNVV